MSDEEKTTAAATMPQCQFFVQRKKRLCRMTVKPGRQYCGEHQPQPNAEAEQTDKRIPCPNDPKHTCYTSKLLKHLAICNARRMEQPPYIVHNINAPEAVDTCPRLPLSSYPKDALANVIDKVNHLYAKHVEGHITAQPPQPIHRAVLPEFSEEDRAESSRRHLRQVSALLWAAEHAGLATSQACYVELGAGKGQLCYYAAHAWCAHTGSRVLAVDRAPLRHKRDNKLRSAPPTRTAPSDTESRVSNVDCQHQKGNINHEDNQLNEIDRNAKKLSTPNKILNSDNISSTVSTEHSTNSKDNGNGETPNKIFNSDTISTNSDNSNVICNSKNTEDGISTTKSNDHMTANSKDGNGETDKSKESEVGVRIRADLAHLALEAVPVVMECEAVVGLAKHLCGVATDYALRCIAAPGVISKSRGLVLATCCHHRIERALYVANQQLQELGINAEEFNIMLGIVSWATCGDGRSRERRLLNPPQEAHEPQRQEEAGRRQEEREQTGRRAKALFDWGRMLWLRARGFDARLCYYVPRDVSLENVAIVAVRR